MSGPAARRIIVVLGYSDGGKAVKLVLTLTAALFAALVARQRGKS